MLAIERRNKIMATLRQNNHVVVSELAKLFDVSEETIRRDLDKLEKQGQVIKTYGGAVISEGNALDLPYIVRKKANIQAKQAIADIASSLIIDGDSIILDASSTAVYIAQKIKNKKDITLITNSIEVLMELADVTGWRIFSTGGWLKERTCALVGNTAERMLTSHRVDKAFISCKGVDATSGFFDSNEMLTLVKQQMLNSAAQVYFAVDSSKFDKISFTLISNFDHVDAVITDTRPAEKWCKLFDQNEIECLYPEN